MIKDSFSKLHPSISFIYFLFVIIGSVFFTNPIFILINNISAFSYSIYLNRKKAFKFNLLFILPFIVIISFFYPVWSHQGITMLFYVDYNPITLESIYYGMALGLTLSAIIMYFSSLFIVITTDKFIYLFGRISPRLSLFFSIILRIIPRIKAQFKVISNGQKAIGKGYTQGNLASMFINFIRIISIIITWLLENIIEVTSSMKARGYGLKGRTSFSLYKINTRDKKILAIFIILLSIVIIGFIIGENTIKYFPMIKIKEKSLISIVVYLAYLGITLIPLIINIKEDIIWKQLA